MSKKTIQRACKIAFLQILLFTSVSAQRVIKMTKSGGVSYVPCKVNGLKLTFIFDTGASDVSLSRTEATFMFKNGYLDSSDIVGTAQYIDATGNTNEATVVNLKEIEFGGYKLKNVRAAIVNSNSAPLLLGQSVFRQIGSVQVNFDTNELIIIERNTPKVAITNYPTIEKVDPKSDISQDEIVIYSSLIEYALSDSNQNYEQSYKRLDSAYVMLNRNSELKGLDTLTFALFWMLGYYNEYENKLEKAESFYSQAIDYGSKLSFVRDLYYARGEIYYKMNNWNRAITDYTLYLKTSFLPYNPKDSVLVAFEKRAECRFQIGEYINSISDYNELLLKANVTPHQKGLYYYHRAKNKFNLEDYYGTIADASKSIGIIDKESTKFRSEVYNLRSNANFFLKNYSLALVDIDQAFQLYNSCTYLYNRGIIKSRLKNKKDACADLSKAGERGCEEAYAAIKEVCNN